LIALKFGMVMRYVTAEVAELLKFTLPVKTKIADNITCCAKLEFQFRSYIHTYIFV